MNLQEYNDNLQELANRTAEVMTEKVLITSGVALLGSMQNRVFRDGRDSGGLKIAEGYSKKGAYFTKDEFVKKAAFKPVGKGGKKANIRARSSDLTTKKTFTKLLPTLESVTVTKAKVVTKVIKPNGEERTSMYLKEGYKEFREIQGRQTGVVNLVLRGDLKLSLTLQSKDDAVLIGFNDEKESKIRRGLEKKYKGKINSIFLASEDEKKEYRKDVIATLRHEELKILNQV